MSFDLVSAEQAAEWQYAGLDGLVSDADIWVARCRYAYSSGAPFEVEVMMPLGAGEVLDAYALDADKLIMTQRASWLRHPSAISAGALFEPASEDVISDSHAVMAAVSILRRKAAVVSGHISGLRRDMGRVAVNDSGLIKMSTVSARLGAVAMAVMAQALYRAGFDDKWKWLSSDGTRAEARAIARGLLPAWRSFLESEQKAYRSWNWYGLKTFFEFLAERYPRAEIDWAHTVKVVTEGDENEIGELPPLP